MGSFVDSVSKGRSQFWQGFHKVKNLFYKGVTFNVNCGKGVRFWLDVWLGRISLPNLYRICRNTEIKVVDCFHEGKWMPGFRWNFGPNEVQEWKTFLDMVHGVQLNEEVDKPIWALDKSKAFTTISLYRFLSCQGTSLPSFNKIWKAKVPLKMKIFLWQM